MTLDNVHCQNLIIKYLTPLPKLPFEKELIQTTRLVLFDVDRYYFYPNFFIAVPTNSNETIPVKVKIRYSKSEWNKRVSEWSIKQVVVIG